VEDYRRFGEQSFDRLDDYLHELKKQGFKKQKLNKERAHAGK
jgi:hypothetical protein